MVRPPLLSESLPGNEVFIGPLFDDTDQQFLRDNESESELDLENSLIPSLVVHSDTSDFEQPDSFESNGLPSVEFVASTPLRTTNHSENIDPFVFASPITPPCESEQVFCEQLGSTGSDYEFLAGIRNRPRRIVYSLSLIHI